jgi:sulfonate transport system substrate-binding protein
VPPTPLSQVPTRSLRTGIRTATALVAVSALAAACGSSGSKSATAVGSVGSSNSSTASKSGIPAGTVLNVGDQQQDLATLLQASGELKGVPYKLNFVQFDSGPLVDAGFAAKRIDVGSMGDLPASVAVSSHLPVKAVATELPIGADEYLLAKPGITSIAQLKGKPVAYTTGTAEQAFALRSLATANLTQKDVKQVNVSLLQLGTVLEAGSADASVVSVEQKIDYQQTHPTAKVLATDISVKPASYSYILATDAAIANPGKKAAIADFLRRFKAALAWQKSHQSAWVQSYYVTVQHQSTAEAKQILAAGGLENIQPVNAKPESALQTVVKLMATAGAIPSAFSVSTLYDPSDEAYFNRAITG